MVAGFVGPERIPVLAVVLDCEFAVEDALEVNTVAGNGRRST